MRYRRAERTALYIETQEGDVVRLKIQLRDAGTAVATVGESGDSLEELSITARNSSKIYFSVDGDLNADELAAIRSVVEQAGALAAEFFAGDLPEAFATAANLSIDGSELARVGLRLSVREQLTYSGPPLLRPSAPAAAPEPTESAAVETAAPAATPAASSAPPLEAPATPAVPAATQPTTPAVPADGASQALTAIADFLRQLLDTLGTTEPNAAISLDFSLKLHVFESLVVGVTRVQPIVAATADGPSGVPLLADTLEGLAATRQPAFNARA